MHQYWKCTSSILLSLKINTSILKVHFKCTSECEKKYVNWESMLQLHFCLLMQICKFWKSTSSVLLSQTTNTWIKKAYFKYVSWLENVWLKFQNLRCLHKWQLFHFIFKCISVFKVYLKNTSFPNPWWTQSILEIYFCESFPKLFFNYLSKVANFASQNVSYTWSMVYI